MSKRTWLDDEIQSARKDFESWPDWMKQGFEPPGAEKKRKAENND